MNREGGHGLDALLDEEGRGFFQDLPLFTQHPVLPPQPAELLTLIAADPRPLADIDLLLLDPVYVTCSVTPRSVAISSTVRPLVLTNSTASRRNCSGYGVSAAWHVHAHLLPWLARPKRSDVHETGALHPACQRERGGRATRPRDAP